MWLCCHQFRWACEIGISVSALHPGFRVRFSAGPPYWSSGRVAYCRRPIHARTCLHQVPWVRIPPAPLCSQRTKNVYLLYCILRRCQLELSALMSLFLSSSRAIVVSRERAHEDSDSAASRAARSNTALSSGVTRTWTTLFCATSFFGLPLPTMDILYCKIILASTCFYVDCVLFCSTINTVK